LLADTYGQMGYQAESGPWRSEYLQGAFELRNGTPKAGGVVTASPDTIRAMSAETLFDYWGVRLNGAKAAGKHTSLVFSFTDLKKKYSLTLENGVPTTSEIVPATADATIALTKPALDALSLGESTPEQSISSGKWHVTGKPEVVTQFFSLLDDFPFWFNIVTP
jgi:alkyl sulfatase BDS1-like metallo-beta-lactamase superfamily hydrolase